MQNTNPLDQLADIHLPDSVGYWPLAWGWWCVIFLAISLLMLLVLWIKKYRKKTAYRKQAAQLLIELKKSACSPKEYLAEASQILRRCANHLFTVQSEKNSSPTNLVGVAWLLWLDAQCPNLKQEFSQGIGQILVSGPYQKNISIDQSQWDQLHQLLIRWIQLHRWNAQWAEQVANKNIAIKNKEALHHV